MKLSDSEIQEREPVWAAFSDLFLDTDVTLSYDYIVRECSKSDYSIEELNRILLEEVAPVVSSNLLSPAGEWSGFDEQWLSEEISKKVQSQSEILRVLFKPINNLGFKGYIGSHWRELKPRIIEARKNT